MNQRETNLQEIQQTRLESGLSFNSPLSQHTVFPLFEWYGRVKLTQNIDSSVGTSRELISYVSAIMSNIPIIRIETIMNRC